MKHKVKVLELSGVENDISTDSSTTGIYAETAEYSITPRTFDFRTLLKTDFSNRVSNTFSALKEKSTKLEKVLQQLSLRDGFENAKKLGVADGMITGTQADLSKVLQKITSDIQVKKFAVDDSILQLQKLYSNFGSLPTEIFFLDQYQHLNKSDARVGPIVHRLGLNLAFMDTKIVSTIFDKDSHYVDSTSVTGSKGGTKTKIKLQHPLEIFLLEDAVKFLKDNPGKTAIIFDIFVRDDEEGKLVWDNDKPEMHSVVLCRTQDQDKYLVVDPSKVSHSSHIAGSGIYDMSFSIIIPNKMHDIYTGQRGKIGPKPDQFRDCIDIAVKLAFGFEKMNGNSVDPQSLSSHEVVRMVSNNTALDDQAIELIKTAPVRLKQRSDVDLMTKFHQIESFLDEDLKRLDVIDKGKAASLEGKYSAILSQIVEPENYKIIIHNLISLDEEIRQETITCLGEVYKNAVEILDE